MGTILLFIIVLSLLVFVHEFGHFVMARLMGMKVEEFGFGFPPRLWGIRRGETIYSINWIPLGGFVKIKGESGEFRSDPDSFSAKKAWKRFLVLIAGVTMNVVLAAILLSAGFMAGLPSLVDDALPSNATVRDEAIIVMDVLDGSPASEAGFSVGDKIVSIDGRTFEYDADARAYIQEDADEDVTIVVEKEDGVDLTYEIKPTYLEETGKNGLGIAFVSTGIVSYPFFSAILHGVTATAHLMWEIILAFYDLIKNLLIAQEVSIDLSGPVGIAVMTGEVAALGFIYLLQFTAILSINLAIINAFPFPALDGGRILFLFIEKLRGRPINERIEMLVHNTGFLLLMAFVILVTVRDLANFGDEIFRALKNF